MFPSEVVELLESGCSLVVGTVGDDGCPRADRGWSVDVLDASTGVFRLIVADDPAALRNLEVPAPVAVTGTDIRTLRSVQVKGRVTALGPITPGGTVAARRHAEAMFDAIEEVDHIPRSLPARLLPAEMLEVTVAAEEVFDQTPGPGAGAPVGGRG